MRRVGVEKKSVLDLLEKIQKTTTMIDDLKVLYELLTANNAEETDWKEFEAEFKNAKTEIEDLYSSTLYDGEHDSADALIELHAGAGGEEAQDWTDMLSRMYTRYAEKKGYSVKVMNYLYGDGAGYKSISLLVEGNNAYGNLKCERGVHRLVRI